MSRKVFLGCGGVAAFFVAALVALAVFWVPRAFKKGKSWVTATIAEAQQIDRFEKSWKPPSPAPDAQWFPPLIESWKLANTNTLPGLPELKIEREVHQAIYTNNADRMEVDVVAANELEHEALFARAQKALEEGKTSRLATRSGHRLYVRTDGTEHTRLWWLKDWLFVFRTHGDTDPESFMQQYLNTMQQPEIEAR